jgi:AraC family transcriptional regulator
MEKPIVTIENADMRIIYIRFRGTYQEFRKNSRKLFQQLFDFAESNNLIIPDFTKVLTIYHDNPFITNEKQLRTSVAMTVPPIIPIEESGDICITEISGKFGVGHFEITAGEYGAAWNYMYEEWLFPGEQKPRDAVPFELYVTEPPKNFKSKSFTDIYIPIE